MESLSAALAKAKEHAGDQSMKERLEKFAHELQTFAPPNARPGAPLSLNALARLESLFSTLQDVDAAPTARVKAAVPEVLREATAVQERWRKFVDETLPELNRQLEAAGLDKLSLGD